MLTTVTDKIYIELLDEDIRVWRPVTARCVAGDVYEILDDNTYAGATETWMFPPGTWVLCKPHNFGDGEKLIAFARAQPHNTVDIEEP